MNTPVEFSIAKLLKEKGFEMAVGSCYYNEEFFINQNIIPLQYPELKGEGYKERVTDKIIFTPTISEVIMWIYKGYGLWISVNTYVGYGDLKNFTFCIEKHGVKKIDSMVYLNLQSHKSPTECYKTAIEYTLKNLI